MSSVETAVQPPPEEPQEIQDPIPSTPHPEIPENTIPSPAVEHTPERIEDTDIRNWMAARTLEQLIAQMMMVDLESVVRISSVTVIGEEERTALEELSPGGVILFSSNLVNREQVRELTDALSRLSSAPFIGIDEEGGRVSRTALIPELGVPRLVSASIRSHQFDPEEVHRQSYEQGLALNDLGISVNFAPVADLDQSGIIGDRSFGTDPEVTASYVSSVVSGLLEAGMFPVIKHFPGHGAAISDPHDGVSISHESWEDVRNVNILPFYKGFEAGGRGVMTGHLSFPEIPESANEQATFSEFFLQTLLREELGFTGIIFSDALNMGAVLEGFSSPEDACIEAIEAGVDVLLMPPDPYRTLQAITQAVEEGVISRERIEESVRRILEKKINFGVLTQSQPEN